MSIEDLFATGKDKMEKAIAQMKKDFAAIRTGRANPMILDKVLLIFCPIKNILI